MISLAAKYPELDTDHLDQLDLRDFVRSVYVSERSKASKTRLFNDIFQAAMSRDLSHNALIDFVIQKQVQHKVDDRLSKGYHYGPDFSTLSNNNNSFHVSFLKSAPWQMVHNRIGKKEFLNLMLQFNCFVRIECKGAVNSFQLFGETFQHNRTVNWEVEKDKYVLKHKMFFREEHQIRFAKPILADTNSMIERIFPSSNPSARQSKTPAKKYRILQGILARVIKNHQQCRYAYVIDEICPVAECSKTEDLREMGTPSKSMIEFVLCIVDQIFPPQIFGSKHNKNIIMSKIALYIRTSRQEKIPRAFLLQDIRVSDVTWTLGGKRTRIAREQLIKRDSLMEGFMNWLLSDFVCKLVSGFFYVTESHAGLLFYRHHLWKRLTKPYMDRYIAKYLSREETQLPFLSFTESDVIQGKMRLIPKAKDFRVINVPFRGSKDESYAYWNYLFNEIKPVRKILLEARKQSKLSQFYCFSIGDVPKRILEFKKRIANPDTLKLKGELYYIKFDAKSCYDSIPKDKVIKCLESLVAAGQVFVCRQLQIGRQLNRLKNVDVLSTINSSLEDLIAPPNGTDVFKNKYILDQTRSVVLTTEDVKRVVEQQLDQTAVMVKRTSYKRRNGVFQGFPLSAIFCDIIYDQLVETYFKSILEDEESLLLRVADDFMVISTDPKQIRRVYDQTKEGFGDFNVNINTDKTKIKLRSGKGDRQVLFCGLTIDINDLHVIKPSDSYGTIAFNGTTHQELYTKLIWAARTRGSSHIINANNPQYAEINLINMLHIFENTIKTFFEKRRIRSIQDKFDGSQFVGFYKAILDIMAEYLIILDDGYEEANQVWRGVLEEECNSIFIDLAIKEKF